MLADESHHIFHPWRRPIPALTDSEFQCFNDPIWRVAKLSRMVRQLQAFMHTWKDLAMLERRSEFHKHSDILGTLINDLSKYAEETRTSFSNHSNEWPHFMLRTYTHMEIAVAFQDDTRLADSGVEDVFKNLSPPEDMD